MNLYFSFSISIIVLLLSLSACDGEKAVETQRMESFEDSVAYAVGMDIAKFYQKQGVKLDAAFIYAGIQDMQTSKTKLTVQEALGVVGKFQQQQRQLNLANAKIEGENFLHTNAKKAGVVTLPTGLQYKVLKEGKGKKPSLDSKVEIEFTGKFIDGTVFTSTVDEGGSLETDVDGLLKGWIEALLLMPEGSRWEIFLPYDLAYGISGFINPDNNQMAIPPYSALIYEIELIEVL